MISPFTVPPPAQTPVPLGIGDTVGPAINAGITGGIGSAIGAVLDWLGQLTSIFRGATKHLDWDTANSRAIAFSQTVSRAIASNVTTVQLQQIADQYRAAMGNWITGSGRWQNLDQQVENNDKIKNAILAQIPGNPQSCTVFNTTWLWAMWTLRNSDVSSTTEWKGIATNDMNGILLPIVKQVTGKDVSLGSADIKSSVTGNQYPATGAFDLAGFGGSGLLVILLVGVAIWYFTKGR